MKIKIILIILLITLLFASCNSDAPLNRQDKHNDPQVRAEVNFLAPDFSVELLSGETVKLSDYRGKVVLINFWATWCGPCVDEMPDIQKISEAYPDDLVVLAINCNESEDRVRDFISSNSYTFNIGLDKGEVQKLYPTNGIPYTIIVNADGIITQTHLGGGRGMFPVFEEYVKNAMG